MDLAFFLSACLLYNFTQNQDFSFKLKIEIKISKMYSKIVPFIGSQILVAFHLHHLHWLPLTSYHHSYDINIPPIIGAFPATLMLQYTLYKSLAGIHCVPFIHAFLFLYFYQLITNEKV